MRDMKDMEVVSITTSCSPVSTGYIANDGWNWSYPAIAKIAGSSGNLEKWVTGYKDLWEDLHDPSKTEESFRWDEPTSRESAWEWFDQAS